MLVISRFIYTLSVPILLFIMYILLIPHPTFHPFFIFLFPELNDLNELKEEDKK